MVDRLRDNDDRRLEALFRSDPIADDGFTAGVMKRVHRRIWVRRLALPIAFVIGAVIALKPLTQLVVAFSKLVAMMPADVVGLPLDSFPQAPTIVLGGALLVAVMVIPKLLDA